jgi:hypothetical protein
MTTAYSLVVALLVSGEKLDALTSGKLMDMANKGTLPFHTVFGSHPNYSLPEQFASPDALLTPLLHGTGSF